METRAPTGAGAAGRHGATCTDWRLGGGQRWRCAGPEEGETWPTPPFLSCLACWLAGWPPPRAPAGTAGSGHSLWIEHLGRGMCIANPPLPHPTCHLADGRRALRLRHASRGGPARASGERAACLRGWLYGSARPCGSARPSGQASASVIDHRAGGRSEQLAGDQPPGAEVYHACAAGWPPEKPRGVGTGRESLRPQGLLAAPAQ